MWRSVGPSLPVAGSLTRSPASPRTLFLLGATPDGLVHRSDDLGATWTSLDGLGSAALEEVAGGLFDPQEISVGPAVLERHALEVHPLDADRMIVSRATVSTFSQAFAAVSSRDGGVVWATLDVPGAPVLMHPLEQSTLYAVGVSTIWKSSDGGETWTDTTLVHDVPTTPAVATISGEVRLLLRQGGEVLVADEDGRLVQQSPLPDDVLALSLGRDGKVHILAGSTPAASRLLVSDDLGATFSPVSPALGPAAPVKELGIESFSLAVEGDRAVVVGTSIARTPTVRVALLFDLTQQGGWIDGSSFEPEYRLTPLADPGLPSPQPGFLARMPRAPSPLRRLRAAALEGGALALGGTGPSGLTAVPWMSLDSGATWSRGELLAVSPADPGRVYVRQGETLMRSDDGGQSFLGLGVRLSDTEGPGSRLVGDALDPDVVFALSARGIDRSADAGRSWQPLLDGTFLDLEAVVVGGEALVVALAGDHIVRYSSEGGSGEQALPEGVVPQALHLPRRGESRWTIQIAGGALVSDDFGGTWRHVDLSTEGLVLLAVDARASSRSAWVLWDGFEGLYWSADEGRTRTNLGLEGGLDGGPLVVDDLVVAAISGDARQGQKGVFVWDRNDGLPCLEGGERLCLQGGRFEVTARWHLGAGGPRVASAAGITPDTGAFWFFDPDNLELVVKVLDACAVNGHFWVFAAGLTDVGVDLEVLDSRSLERRAFASELGAPYRPVQDVRAFRCALPRGDRRSLSSVAGTTRPPD